MLTQCVCSGEHSAHARGVGFLFSLASKQPLNDRYKLGTYRVNTVFVPVMASRLMLSLKKAAAKPTVPWSLTTMTNSGKGKTPEIGTIRFASWTLSGSQEISGTLSPSNEGDVELESMPSNRR